MTGRSRRGRRVPGKRQGTSADRSRPYVGPDTFGPGEHGPSAPVENVHQEVIFLLGAGASMDAGVPDSDTLLTTISDLCASRPRWKRFAPLHESLMNAIALRAASGGVADQLSAERPLEKRQLDPNIETLVDALQARIDEDPQNKDNKKFMRMIKREVGRQVDLRNPRRAAYLGKIAGLSALARRVIRVFTLNFDCAFELNRNSNFDVVTGFGGVGKRFPWFIGNFSVLFLGPTVYLYKMHGSIDWRFTASGKLVSVRLGKRVDYANAAIVLGFRDKAKQLLRYPYKIYKEIFIEAARTARQIVIVGYRLGDKEINDLIDEALKNSGLKNLVVVRPFDDPTEKDEMMRNMKRQFGSVDKVVVKPVTAKRFFEELPDNTRFDEKLGLEIIVGNRGHDR